MKTENKFQTVANEGYGVISYDIKGIRPIDADKLIESEAKLARVIKSHLEKDGKKEYLTLDNMIAIWKQLNMLTSGLSHREPSIFDSMSDDDAKRLIMEHYVDSKEPKSQSPLCASSIGDCAE